MPRFVTVYLQCDAPDCDAAAEEGSGLVFERTITMDKAPAKAFLVCKPHSDALDEVLVPLLQKGIKVDQAPAKKKTGGTPAASASGDPGAGTGNGHPAESFECQHDGCGRVLKNRTGMAQHAIRTHGYDDLASYEAVHGQLMAID